MHSGFVNFLVLLGITLCVWLLLKPFFPEVTFVKRFEQVTMGWLLCAFAIWMAIIYAALGFAVCAVVMVLANFLGLSATLDDFVNSIARRYLDFLPARLAEKWPAIIFGVLIAAWSFHSARKDDRQSHPLIVSDPHDVA